MRLVVLDRDGVINRDSDDYIKSPDEWEPIPGSLEAIARLCRDDYKVVIATNQSGVGRGMFSMDTLNKIHVRMLEAVREKGGEIEAVFFCPHTPEDRCSCRKPRPGMLLEIQERLKASLAGVPMVGDALRDVEAAQAVNGLPVLLRTGKGSRTIDALSAEEVRDRLMHVPIFDDLSAFVDALLYGKLKKETAQVMRRAGRVGTTGTR
jgi:D-glycero-D-manno-heptose 1,7-bisphosphate phosphatase